MQTIDAVLGIIGGIVGILMLYTVIRELFNTDPPTRSDIARMLGEPLPPNTPPAGGKDVRHGEK